MAKKNVKVKGENVKELTFEVKDLNLDERIDFNNIITKSGGIAIANRCYEVVNKKKLKKSL